MAHESRLTHELRLLLQAQRVAALGTLHSDGNPMVSMVPYAIDDAHPILYAHVSGLAAHTSNMQRTPAVSLLVMQAEVPGEPVHALPRVTLQGRAETLMPESPAWQVARCAYLQRFPGAAHMTQLADFRFVAIHLTGARQIAGFGAARSLDADELRSMFARD